MAGAEKLVWGGLLPATVTILSPKRFTYFFPLRVPFPATIIFSKREDIMEENLRKTLGRHLFMLAVLDIVQVLTRLILITMLHGRFLNSYFAIEVIKSLRGYVNYARSHNK